MYCSTTLHTSSCKIDVSKKNNTSTHDYYSSAFYVLTQMSNWISRLTLSLRVGTVELLYLTLSELLRVLGIR